MSRNGSRQERRVALVTGASSGIGRACALYLARQGLRVYGASRRAAPGGGDSAEGFSALHMDVVDDRSVEQGVAALLSREGRLDIVVNNAGMGIAGSVESTSIEEAKQQFEVNFFGVLRVCRAALPAMRKQGAGCIVNIGSIGGVVAIPFQALYSASKFALEGLSEALRLEVRPLGIHVVLIEPGDHRTAFTENRRPTRKSCDDEVYREPFSSALKKMVEGEQGGPGPEKVARLLYHVVSLREPRLRYTVGLPEQRAAVWVKRLLPYSVIERGMRRYYSL